MNNDGFLPCSQVPIQRQPGNTNAPDLVEFKSDKRTEAGRKEADFSRNFFVFYLSKV